MTALEFSDTLHQTSKTLKPYALKWTQDLEDAKDLLQETLIKAFLNREKFAEGTNLKAWLFTIMRNTFITQYKKKSSRNTFIYNSGDLHSLQSPSHHEQNAAYASFAQEELTKALEEVDAQFKVPFMMYFKGYRYHEIAKNLSIPIGTVKNRIHIARKRLRERLLVYSSMSVN